MKEILDQSKIVFIDQNEPQFIAYTFFSPGNQNPKTSFLFLFAIPKSCIYLKNHNCKIVGHCLLDNR